ncbi:MAG TPA: hypothetical protein VFO39_02140 [Candidatus Sulfotelmatobacter sp.]|nr:hypothetical protein [Candidatus Sulfotelmatobacter sp.]
MAAYIEIISTVRMARFDLSALELWAIGDFTRENIVSWLNRGNFFEIGIYGWEDFHAVCGDIDIPWTDERAKLYGSKWFAQMYPHKLRVMMRTFEELQAMPAGPEYEQACREWLRTAAKASLDDIRSAASSPTPEHTSCLEGWCLACLKALWVKEAIYYSPHCPEEFKRDYQPAQFNKP